MQFGYVCTNYNNSAFTRAAVESLASASGLVGIVVVDNKSDQQSVKELEALESEFDIVDVIYGTENIGYFRGLNAGIRQFRDAHPGVDVLVVGNNDLIFPQDFQHQLVCNERLLNRSAVVSPNVVTIDGMHQNPHVIETISWKRELIYDLYYSNYLAALAIGKLARLTRKLTDRPDELQWEVGREIYQGHGSVYILTRKFFEIFDELWAPSFLMYEEYFLSKQLSDKGLRVYYEPTITVSHHCHAAVGQIPNKTMWEFARTSHRIYRKHVKVFGS